MCAVVIILAKRVDFLFHNFVIEMVSNRAVQSGEKLNTSSLWNEVVESSVSHCNCFAINFVDETTWIHSILNLGVILQAHELTVLPACLLLKNAFCFIESSNLGNIAGLTSPAICEFYPCPFWLIRG